MPVLLALLFWLGLCIGAIAEEPHDHALMGKVGEFYSKWMVPNQGRPRQVSCCNQQDCHEAQLRRSNGRWEFMSRDTRQWTSIPEAIIEYNQRDGLDSPDGKPHVCERSGRPICFVVKGGDT